MIQSAYCVCYLHLYLLLIVKHENEAKRTASKGANSTNILDSSATGDASSNSGNLPLTKSRAENVHERIGFNPMPKNT